MMPDGGLRRFRRPVAGAIRATRGSPRQVELDGARPAGQLRGDERHDRLALVGPDLEHRDAVIGHGVGEQVEQPPDHLEPVDAAVERQHRLERGRDRQARHRVVPDVRQVGEDDVEASGIGRQQVGLGERDPVRDRVPDRVLPGEPQRVRRDVDGQDPDGVESLDPPQAHGQRHGDGAAPRAHVDDLEVAAPGRPRARGQPPQNLVPRQVDEALRLGSRDQRACVDLEGEPVELLDPAQVGHGLAGRPPLEIGAIPPGRIGSDRRLGMRDDGRPARPDRLAEQKFGVEARCLGPGRGKAIGTFPEQLPGRLDR